MPTFISVVEKRCCTFVVEHPVFLGVSLWLGGIFDEFCGQDFVVFIFFLFFAKFDAVSSSS